MRYREKQKGARQKPLYAAADNRAIPEKQNRAYTFHFYQSDQSAGRRAHTKPCFSYVKLQDQGARSRARGKVGRYDPEGDFFDKLSKNIEAEKLNLP